MDKSILFLFFLLLSAKAQKDSRTVFLQSVTEKFNLSPKLKLAENYNDGVFLLADGNIREEEPIISLPFDKIFPLDLNFPFRREIFLYCIDKIEVKRELSLLNRVIGSLGFLFYLTESDKTLEEVQKLEKEAEYNPLNPDLKEYLLQIPPSNSYFSFDSTDFSLLSKLKIPLTDKNQKRAKQIRKYVMRSLSKEAKILLKTNLFTEKRLLETLSIFDARSFLLNPVEVDKLPEEFHSKILFSKEAKRGNVNRIGYQMLTPLIDLVNYCNFKEGKPDSYTGKLAVDKDRLTFSVSYNVFKGKPYCFTYVASPNLTLLEYYGFVPHINVFDEVKVKLDKEPFNPDFVDLVEVHYFRGQSDLDHFELKYRLYSHFDSKKVIHTLLTGKPYTEGNSKTQLETLLYEADLIRKAAEEVSFDFIIHAINKGRKAFTSMDDPVFKRRTVFFEYLVMRNRILTQAEFNLMQAIDQKIREMGFE